MNGVPSFSARAAASRVANRDASPDARLLAARALVDRGLVDGVLVALEDLASAHAPAVRKLALQVQYVEQTTRWLDFDGRQGLAGRWEALDGRPVGEALESDAVLSWVHPGATRTVVAFSHLEGGFGPMAGWHSLGLVHRILRPLGVNVVYALDQSRRLHFGGIRGLGDDYPDCLDRLKTLFADRRWDRVYAIGVSSGGFSALRYGLDLGARAVLSMSGTTDLANYDPADRDPRLDGFYRDFPGFAVDLLALYRGSARRPHLVLCYGELNEHDRNMAERMAELPETELVPFAGFAGHSTFIEGLRTGRLGQLAARLLTSA